VFATPGAAQAYALLAATSRDNNRAISLYFEPAPGGWRVRNFNINASKMAGKDSDDLLMLGRREQKAGHLLSAQMLFVAARTLLDRGDIVHLPAARKIDAELAALSLPPEFDGSLPKTWLLNGHDYTVSYVTIYAMKDKLGLRFDLPGQSWSSDAEADAKNRTFLEDFRAAHPESTGVFGVWQANLLTQEKKSGYVTTFDGAAGYVTQ
jgi:hypothetical protein